MTDAPDRRPELVAMRAAVRAVGAVQKGTDVVAKARGAIGFPLRAPTVPPGVEVPPAPGRTGADFDTAWARRPLARAVRTGIVTALVRPTIGAIAAPEVRGLDRLSDLRPAGDDEPPTVIFAANHASHLDAPLMLTAIPEPWRRRLVIGAAADYFFATRLTGTASALALGAFPIDRSKVNRRSADLAASLLDDGWSIVIFPEGGRSPDGWAQPFRGGAAFLSLRCGVPVVPVHLEGTGELFGKGMSRPRVGTTIVTFGSPIRPQAGDDARALSARIEHQVAVLGDEAAHDWWTARRKAADGSTTPLGGPETTSWRRSWALGAHRARSGAGRRRRVDRTWPDLG